MPETGSDFNQEYRYDEPSEALSQSSSAAEIVPSASYLVDPHHLLDTLIRAVGQEVAQEFFWKADTGPIQTYEHRHTYRFLHIDRITGQCCDGQRNPISLERALAHALPMRMAPTSPTSWMLAPVVLELDLAPFVRGAETARPDQPRLTASQEEAVRPARLGGFVLRAYRHFQAKFSSLGAFAKAASAPAGERTEATRANLQSGDLSLAAFTRRVA